MLPEVEEVDIKIDEKLGDTALTDRPLPFQVGGLASMTIGLGGATTCAGSGTNVSCWGRNAYGEVGDGTFVDRTSPTTVSWPAGAVTELGVGMNHTCALAGTELYCWGDNIDGELGLGATDRTLTPVLVAL